MIILYDNEILNSTNTTNSENSDYPLSNLQDTRAAKFFRTLTDSAVRIVFNKTSLNADWFFILNHNITSGATIKLEANATDSWGSPSLSETITWNADTMFLDFTEATYNYWSLYVDDSSNPDAFIQIGLCVLGKALVMPGQTTNPTIRYIDTSQKTRSTSGQSYKDIRYNYRTISSVFPIITQSEFDDIETMIRFHWNNGPVMMYMWEESPGSQSPMYCDINQTIEQKKLDQSGIAYTINLDFEEVF